MTLELPSAMLEDHFEGFSLCLYYLPESGFPQRTSSERLPAKNYLKDQHDISVHFSNLHYNYYSAWKYVIKEDKQVLQSENLPDLWHSKPS